MSTLIYSHSACLAHEPGPGHPESPERLVAVLKALQAPGFEALQWREAPMGTREQVLHVHTEDYVEQVESLAPQSGYQLLDAGDTVMSPGTLEAVMRCVGAACAAVDAVAAGEARNAFCATRAPVRGTRSAWRTTSSTCRCVRAADRSPSAPACSRNCCPRCAGSPPSW